MRLVRRAAALLTARDGAAPTVDDVAAFLCACGLEVNAGGASAATVRRLLICSRMSATAFEYFANKVDADGVGARAFNTYNVCRPTEWDKLRDECAKSGVSAEEVAQLVLRVLRSIEDFPRRNEGAKSMPYNDAKELLSSTLLDAQLQRFSCVPSRRCRRRRRCCRRAATGRRPRRPPLQ